MKKNAYARIIVILMSASALMLHLQCSKIEMPPEPTPEVASTPPPEADFSVVSNQNGVVTLNRNSALSELWSISWDFGDGKGLSKSTEVQQTRQYFNKGDYDITLRVALISNDAIQHTQTIRVSVDPTWEIISKFPFSRTKSCFFTTINGIFALVSDENLAVNNKVWQMDPNTGAWSEKWEAPFKIHGMHTAVLGEKVYFGCGRNGAYDSDHLFRLNPVQDFWMLDLSSGAWSHLPSLSQPESSITSFCAAGGQLFALRVDNLGQAGQFWKYTPGQNAWTLEGAFNAGGQGIYADSKLAGLKNKVYWIGGLKTWEYNVDSKTWSDIGAFNVLSINAFIMSDDTQNHLYVGGGVVFSFGFSFGIWGDDNSSSGYQIYPNYSIFDTGNNTWSEEKFLPDLNSFTAKIGVTDGFYFNNVPYFVSWDNTIYQYTL